MRRATTLVCSVLASALTLAGSGRAIAQEYGPPLSSRSQDRPWELAGKASYLTPPVGGGTSPFGAGFGGRLGLNIGGVYIGGSLVDYLGQTDVDAWAHGFLYGGELGYGVHLHEFDGAVLVLRPQVGVGGLTVFHTTPNTPGSTSTSGAVQAKAKVDVITTATGGTSSSSSGTGSSSGGILSSSSGTGAASTTTTTVSNIYVQPGVTLLLSSPTTFAGLNASMLVIPGLSYGDNSAMTWVSYGLEGQLGVRF